MPSIEKKEIERIQKRLEEIYTSLDGKLGSEKGEDEFTRVQNSIKEDLM